MNTRVKAIVLRVVKHSDTQDIVHLYTEEFGKISALAGSIHSRKSKTRAVYLQPLSILEAEVSSMHGKDLYRLKEATPSVTLHSVQTHPVKQSIAFFVAEVLGKTLRIPQSDPALFSFITGAIEMLEHSESETANFPVFFLLQYSRFQGFYPSGKWTEQSPLFSLTAGRFTSVEEGGYTIPSDASMVLSDILNLPFSEVDLVQTSRDMRFYLTGKMVEYYKLHMELKTDLKSLQILREVLGA